MLGLKLQLHNALHTTLDIKQRQSLKHILQLSNELRAPAFPNAAQGIDGMKTAHRILQTRGAVGVLIGGLSESVWNQRRTPKDLLKHKDVDVAVLDKSFLLKEEFEGGIDWWLPKNAIIDTISDTGKATHEQNWFENMNDVVLSFCIRTEIKLIPGLYIPDPDWIISMRETEVNANIDSNRVGLSFDDDVFEKFRSDVQKRVKSCLPKFIKDEFKNYILDENVLSLYELDIEKRLAISRLKDKL